MIQLLPKEKIFLLELNGTSLPLLTKAASLPALKHIAYLSNMDKTTTSGPPADGENTVWQALGQHGIGCGVWGVVAHRSAGVPPAYDPVITESSQTNDPANGTNGRAGRPRSDNSDASKFDFFLLDPWTSASKPHPARLAGLTGYAQYIAVNHMKLNPLRVMQHSLIYLLALIRYVGITDMLVASLLFFNGLFTLGPKNVVLGAFYEYTSAIACIKQKQINKPSLTILCINLIAHLSDQSLESLQSLAPETELPPQLRYCFKVIDCILARVIRSVSPDELLLVADITSAEGFVFQSLRICPEQLPNQDLDNHLLRFLRVGGSINAGP